MGETLRVVQGTTLDRTVKLQAEGTGAIVTTYTGSETLALKVWPGGTRANVAFNAANTKLAFKSPASDGLASLTLHQADTAGWAPGWLYVDATLTSAGRTVPVFGEPIMLEVLPSPGATAAGPVYDTWADLVRVAPWISGLLTDNATLSADLNEYRARARTTINDVILAADDAARRRARRYRGYVPLDWTGTAPQDQEWLRAQLDANRLMTTGTRGDRLREASARLAVAYACESQIGTGPGDTPYQEVARRYTGKAHEILAGYTAEIDTNGDGVPDHRIFCGLRSSR